MQVGFVVPHVGPGASIDAVDLTCRQAEDLGADSLWVVDHIAIPAQIKARYPYAGAFGATATTPWWECFSVLAYVAARTSRVKLGTGVAILPYRHPLDTAKRVATIDVLSRGRVLFGVGVGWLKDEFDSLQLATFHERGAVADEQLRIIKAAWQHDRVSHHGHFYHFDDVGISPKPVQQPHPPVLVGGNSDAALRRCVELGDGWHALGLLADELAAQRVRLSAMAAAAGRRTGIAVSMFLPIVLTDDPDVRGHLDDDTRRQAIVGTREQVAEELHRYREAGLDHLMTAVSAPGGAPGADMAHGMTLFLRDVWGLVN